MKFEKVTVNESSRMGVHSGRVGTMLGGVT